MSTLYFEDRRYAPRVTLHRWGPHGGQRCGRGAPGPGYGTTAWSCATSTVSTSSTSTRSARTRRWPTFPRRLGCRLPVGRTGCLHPARAAVEPAEGPAARARAGSPRPRPSRPGRAHRGRRLTSDDQKQQTPLTMVPRGLRAPVTLESVAPTRAGVRCPPGLLAAIRRWPHGGSLTGFRHAACVRSCTLAEGRFCSPAPASIAAQLPGLHSCRCGRWLARAGKAS